MPDPAAYPEPLLRLIDAFRRLPGIGKRTAERLALALLEWPTDALQQLGHAIADLRDSIHFCEVCGNLATGRLCVICQAPNRERDLLCVVEQASQIAIIEASRSYHGLYHVLGGRIVPLAGCGPEQLSIEPLRQRLACGEIQELILATSPDVEGEATANYLAAEFAALPVRITRIAAGVPVGSDLSYADAATLAMALTTRRPLSGPGSASFFRDNPAAGR